MFEANPGLMVIVRIVIIMGVRLILSLPVFNTLDTNSPPILYCDAIHDTKRSNPLPSFRSSDADDVS